MRAIGLFAFVVGCLAWTSAVLAACAPDRVALRGAWGQAEFSVELAQTPDARSRGLMHRESMPSRAGMLFVYDAPQSVSFWMRNTLIPLDMLFVDRLGVVRRIHSNAIPLDETPIPGGPNIFAVLEINGGLSEALGLGVGTELHHPAFGPNAAWSCDL